MKRYVKQPIECGVFVDKDNVTRFNWTRDVMDRDLIWLKRPSSGYLTKDGVMIVYGYEYADPHYPKDKLHAFREFIKHPDYSTDDVEKFVINGINNFCKVSDMDNYSVLIGVPSKKKPSILDEMKSQLREICDIYMSLDLVKETYKNVKFDEDKARTALSKSKYDRDIDDTIEFIKEKFEALKKSNQLFEMKRFLPREIRVAFSDFLKFGSEQEREVYEELQGVNVLMYDDLFTSGSTLREMARYLRSINPTNTLTAFVLIKQSDR